MPIEPNYFSPLWRFIMTELDGTVVTWLDRLASQRQMSFILNGPAVFNCDVPSDNPEVNRLWDASGTLYDDEPYVAEGVRHVYGFRREIFDPETLIWVCRYGGTVLQIEDVAESDIARSRVSAYDPWQLLYSRAVRNVDGELPGEDGISWTATKANVIAAQLLRNTIDAEGTVYVDAGTTYSGTAFYDGDFEDCPEVDINFPPGTMVGEAWTTLCSMAKIDIILSPLWDPANRPGYLAQMNTYPLAGEEKPTAIFGWDKAPRSLVGVTDLEDGTQRANLVQYFAGQGGPAVTPAEDTTSQGKYGVYEALQHFPGIEGDGWTAAVEALAEAEVALRANGQRTVTISPAPERSPSPFTDYYLGDRVPVVSSNRLRKALDGYQRVYGIPVEVDDNALETVRSLLASPQTGEVA